MFARNLRTMTFAVALALGAPLTTLAAGPNGPVSDGQNGQGPVAAGPNGPASTGQNGPGPVAAGAGIGTGTCTTCTPCTTCGNGAGGATPTPVAYVAPTADEAADMTFMREEEKLARDLYVAFDEAWGGWPFANIASAEQQHLNTLLKMLIKYRLPDPAAGKLLGEFTDPVLQKAYADLAAKGLRSRLDALQVGGLVEEVDIEDNLASAAATEKADLDTVYAALTCGSRNHLRSFAAAIQTATGKPYVAQSLPQADVNAILAQPMETCGRPW